MKERSDTGVDTDKNDREVKSGDIPNAHAAGDGAIGRSDEDIAETIKNSGTDKKKEENDRTEY